MSPEDQAVAWTRAQVQDIVHAEWEDPRDEVRPEDCNIDDETCQAGVGPLTIDVEMARSHGWHGRQIAEVWALLATASRKHGRVAAWREGRRELCEWCESWVEATSQVPAHTFDDGSVRPAAQACPACRRADPL